MSEGKREERERNSVEMVIQNRIFWIIALLVNTVYEPRGAFGSWCLRLYFIIIIISFVKKYILFKKKKGIVFALLLKMNNGKPLRFVEEQTQQRNYSTRERVGLKRIRKVCVRVNCYAYSRALKVG